MAVWMVDTSAQTTCSSSLISSGKYIQYDYNVDFVHCGHDNIWKNVHFVTLYAIVMMAVW